MLSNFFINDALFGNFDNILRDIKQRIEQEGDDVSFNEEMLKSLKTQGDELIKAVLVQLAEIDKRIFMEAEVEFDEEVDEELASEIASKSEGRLAWFKKLFKKPFESKFFSKKNDNSELNDVTQLEDVNVSIESIGYVFEADYHNQRIQDLTDYIHGIHQHLSALIFYLRARIYSASIDDDQEVERLESNNSPWKSFEYFFNSVGGFVVDYLTPTKKSDKFAHLDEQEETIPNAGPLHAIYEMRKTCQYLDDWLKANELLIKDLPIDVSQSDLNLEHLVNCIYVKLQAHYDVNRQEIRLDEIRASLARNIKRRFNPDFNIVIEPKGATESVSFIIPGEVEEEDFPRLQSEHYKSFEENFKMYFSEELLAVFSFVFPQNSALGTLNLHKTSLETFITSQFQAVSMRIDQGIEDVITLQPRSLNENNGAKIQCRGGFCIQDHDNEYGLPETILKFNYDLLYVLWIEDENIKLRIEHFNLTNFSSGSDAELTNTARNVIQFLHELEQDLATLPKFSELMIEEEDLLEQIITEFSKTKIESRAEYEIEDEVQTHPTTPEPIAKSPRTPSSYLQMSTPTTFSGALPPPVSSPITLKKTSTPKKHVCRELDEAGEVSEIARVLFK